jgi:hypothetical protein
VSRRRIVSASEYGTATRCGEKWYREYVLDQRGESTISQIRGQAVHATIRRNLRSKRDSGELLGADEIEDDVISQFRAKIENDGVRFTSAEMAEDRTKLQNTEETRSRALALLHAAEVAPDIVPTDVEVEVTSTKPLGVLRDSHLVGVLDVVDSGDLVRDTKTGTRKKSAFDVAGDVGLEMYALLHRERTGMKPRGVRLDSLVVTPTWPENSRGKLYYQPELPTLSIEDERLDARLEAMGRVVAIRDLVLGGKAPPPPPAVTGRDWWCSERFCPHTGTCPFYNRAADSGAR